MHEVSNKNGEMLLELALGNDRTVMSTQKFFKSRLVTKYSKLKLYRTIIRPVVTYECSKKLQFRNC